MATKIVPRPEMTTKDKLYLPAVVGGLGKTIRHFFGVLWDRLFRWENKKFAITLEYPEEQWDYKDNFRGAPALVKDQFGRMKCVACQICEFVCPPKAITIYPAEFDDKTNNIEKYPREFEIDMLRCIYCGFCEEACPEEAIYLMREAEIVGRTKAEFVNDREKLLEMGGVREDRIRKWHSK